MASELSGPNCRVTILGRSGLVYREGARTVNVDGEMLTGSHDFVVYVDSIRTWEDSGDAIDAKERQRILSSIESAFRQQGLAVVFE